MFKKIFGSVKFIKAPTGFKLKAFRFVVNTLTHLYCCLYIYTHILFICIKNNGAILQIKLMGNSSNPNIFNFLKSKKVAVDMCIQFEQFFKIHVHVC